MLDDSQREQSVVIMNTTGHNVHPEHDHKRVTGRHGSCGTVRRLFRQSSLALICRAQFSSSSYTLSATETGANFLTWRDGYKDRVEKHRKQSNRCTSRGKMAFHQNGTAMTLTHKTWRTQ